MNRILFEKGEIEDGIARCGGERAEHIVTVLHGEVGQTLKTGEVDGRIGSGVIVEIAGDGVKTPHSVAVKVTHESESLEPWVDLVLAPPRPRVMKRLLPQLAAMGVGRIALVGAEKVERDFWGATLLKEENYRPLLVDGLMQAGTSVLPQLECWKSFRRFMRERLDSFAATDNRIVAHPYGADRAAAGGAAGRLTLAIGPEGGWTGAEVAALEERGFRRYSLGPRILRTDTAAVALLARLMA